MSAESPGAAPADGTEARSRRRLKPSHVTMIIAFVLALVVTAGSGIIAAIEGWEDKSPVTRAAFFDVPSPLRVLFYTVIPVLFLAGGYLFTLRVQNWERGQPDDRATTTKNVSHRIRDFRDGVYMRTLLRDPAAGLMHSFIYF